LGGAEGGKTAKVNIDIDIDTSGSKPSLRFKEGSGTEYDVSLFNDKELVGTAVLTTSQAGRGPRDRSIKFEKKETLAPEGGEGRVRGEMLGWLLGDLHRALHVGVQRAVVVEEALVLEGQRRVLPLQQEAGLERRPGPRDLVR
jgi:hypothetical protein